MKCLEKELTLRVSECDVHSRWRPGAMLIEMQEAAGEHSGTEGCGRDTLGRMGLAWVVARMDLQVLRYPGFGERVTVRTFHRPVRHRFFPRYFQILDGEGQLIAQASSLWLLMDLETRQSVPADRLPRPLTDNSDMPEIMSMPGGIAALDAPERVTSRTAVYSDLDINGHVNNTRYMDWLCDALGAGTMAEHPPERVTIHFDHEIRPEEPIELHLRQRGAEFELTGVHGDRQAFHMGGRLSGYPEG